MDTTKFQTSFIPKKPVVGPQSTRASGGIFYVLGSIIFTIAIIASIGVFGYQKFLEGKIAKMEIDLAQAREALDPELIKEISRTNNRFVYAEEIINKHQTTSSFFNVLEKLTLQSLRFSSIVYNTDVQGLLVTLKGEAKSYSVIALQSKIFSEDKNFVDPQFSDLDLNEQGNVVFTFKSHLNPDVVSYKSMIDSLSLPLIDLSVPSQSESSVATTTTESLPDVSLETPTP